MSLFSWFKPKEQTETKTKITRSIPISRDLTESLVVNSGLTYGLFHNSYPGMKLAGGIAFPAIATPVFFMGTPSIVSEDDDFQEEANKILDKYRVMFQQIHIQSHRDGTIWIWPKYNSKSGKTILEFINDDSMQTILKDIETGQVEELYSDEDLNIQKSIDEEESLRRKRHWSRTFVTESLDGSIRRYKNPLKILPIHFSNNPDGNEVRGRSDYERIVPLLKAYHDISLNENETLARFKTKQVQYVKDVDEWLSNNGLSTSDLTDVDISDMDLIINRVDQEEKTDYVFAEGATSDHREAKQQLFHQIVEASGIPEIIWGLKTTGNHASVEEQMAVLVEYVDDKRKQKEDAYRMLFDAIFSIEAALNFQTEVPEYEIVWNDLDALSEKTKSEVFSSFAKGINLLMDKAAITKDQLFKLWSGLYPNATDVTEDEFKKGLTDMASFLQFTKEKYSDALAMAGTMTDNDIDRMNAGIPLDKVRRNSPVFNKA